MQTIDNRLPRRKEDWASSGGSTLSASVSRASIPTQMLRSSQLDVGLALLVQDYKLTYQQARSKIGMCQKGVIKTKILH